MSLPPLLDYETVSEYKQHYEKHYQRGNIFTVDGIRVYFQPQKFGHAFYKNSQGKSGDKDVFAPERAQRMDWIRATLAHPDARLYFGWNKATRCYDEGRRVSVIYENFVVVIELGLTRKNELRANFVTCYVADASIEAIENSPIWSKEKCLENLNEIKKCR